MDVAGYSFLSFVIGVLVGCFGMYAGLDHTDKLK
jgi:hypothetical protein